MKTSTHFLSYLTQFVLEWEMFQTKFVEKIKTHFMFNNVFRKSCHLWDNMGKCRRAWLPKNDGMPHVHCLLDTKGCKHTLRICNTFCFSMATVVACMHLNILICIQHNLCFIFPQYAVYFAILSFSGSLILKFL